MDLIISDVVNECIRQINKWGIQNHTPLEWLVILMEEVGEASQEALRVRFNENYPVESFKEEMIQVAAVALSIIDCIDRDEWR